MAFRQRKMAELPTDLQALITAVGLSPIVDEGAVWNCHGTPVILHKALERIADHKGIFFDAPQVIEADSLNKVAVICVTGHDGDNKAWSIGEAAPTNNKNDYPHAMAEKRAKDRVILKLIGASGFVYSEEEADDFKQSRPQAQPEPTPEPVPEPQPEPEPVVTTDDDEKFCNLFVAEVDKKILEANKVNVSKLIAWAKSSVTAEKAAKLRKHFPDIADDVKSKIQSRIKELKG